MSAHILLNLLTGLGKRDKMRGLPRGEAENCLHFNDIYLNIVLF